MKLKIAHFALITILILISYNPKIEACSCVPPASPIESLDQSDVVFVGKVIKIEEPISKITSSADPVKVSFDVSKTWKGSDVRALSLTTALSSASCGYDFKMNEEYLVYANGPDNNLNVDICGRTSLLSNANYDLRELGDVNRVSTDNTDSVSQSSDFVSIASVVSIMATIFVVTGIVFTISILKKRKGIKLS